MQTRHIFTEFPEPAPLRTDLAAILEACPAGDLQRMFRLQEETASCYVRTREANPVVDRLLVAMAGRDMDAEITTASWSARKAA